MKPSYLMNALEGLSPSTAQLLHNTNHDPGVLRPMYDPSNPNRVYCYITNTKKIDPETKKPGEYIFIRNATSTMRKEDWIALDGAVMEVARDRLRLVADLNAAGLTVNLANGMGKTVYQYQRQSDINEATLSMDPIRESQKDRPVYDLVNLPLPIAHKDFEFTQRQIAVSNNSNTPLDTTTARIAARKVAEQVEQLAVGVLSYPAYGGGTIYGLVNHPSVNTYDVVAPTESGWTGTTFIANILAMRAALYADKHYGPYMVYVSTDWDAYLDADFSTLKGDASVRSRALQIDGIQGIRALDYLTSGYRIVLVEMNPATIQMINGIPMMTLNWESFGGLMQHFKVMTQQIPLVRADINGNIGIVYGVPA